MDRKLNFSEVKKTNICMGNLKANGTSKSAAVLVQGGAPVEW